MAASRVVVRAPTSSDLAAFIAAARRSRVLHDSWVKAPATPLAFSQYLERVSAPGNHGFLICRRDNGELVGVVNLTNVVMGAFRSGYLGYYAFAGQERQGLMREGLNAVVRHAFGPLKLHRVEANIQPTNLASIALVRRCGVQREGYSPRYLKIAGRWRDHERWARLAD
jgi:ribosomal-protein-alanine N-acetyltransferase